MHSKAMHNSQQISSNQNNQSKLVAFPQATPELPWEVAPLNLLEPAQQVLFKHQAKIRLEIDTIFKAKFVLKKQDKLNL